MEINQNQKRVPTDLIYLVKYSVMGERSPEALATEALEILNTTPKSSLYKLIKTGQFSEKGSTEIKFVTIANNLKPLFKKEKGKIKNSAEAVKILQNGKSFLDIFFKLVSETFNKDWNVDLSESMIFSTNYFAAFSKLALEYKKEKMTDAQMKASLKRLKINISRQLNKNNENSSSFENMKGPNDEIFWNKNTKIPHKRAGVNAIFEFLKKKQGKLN